MPDFIKAVGSTSGILDINILDSTKTGTTQAGLTGLAFNTALLTCYYHRSGDASATIVNLVTMTAGTYTSSGFVEVDATHMPGAYQLCLPDAAFAAGTQVNVTLQGAANMVQKNIVVQLTAANLDNGTNLGLTDIDATISSRSTYAGGAVASVTGNVGGNVTGSVGSVLGNVGGNLLGTLTSTERNAIGTALLKLDWTTVTGEAARSCLNALRFLRNKWSVAATTLTVTKEDDTTAAWTAALTVDGSAQPITSSDPT